MKLKYRLELDGANVTDLWDERVLSVTIDDHAGIKADTCEIVLDARPDRRDNYAIAAPPIDAELRIWIGYAPAPAYMGRYKVSSWSKEGRFTRSR